MPGCLRCDPVLYTGYPPGTGWPPGWGGTPGGPGTPIYPLDALAILSIAPASAVCLTADVLVTATGQNFTPTTEILFDGAPATLMFGKATYVSPTQMTFTVKPSAEPVPRTAVITCRDTAGYGAGLGSCNFQFTAAPILTVTCPLQPASAVVSSAPLTVTVKGTLFTAASIVMLDGVDQATTFVDAQTLTFQLTPGATATTHTVSVKDGANTAATTCPFQVTLTPLLTVTCPVTPATAVAGTPDLQVTVNGTNFTAATVGTIDGADAVTTPGSATSFTMTVPVSTYTTAATLQIGAKDGANTAVATCPFTITVATLLPIITCPCVPATGIIGTANITVDVNGQNFTPTCVVYADGSPAAGSVYVSPTLMRFTATTSTEPAARQAIISVRDGAVSTVDTCPFDYTAIPRPTVTYVFPDMIGMDDPVKTATVTGTNFQADTQIILTATPVVTRFISATQVEFDTESPMWSNGQMTLRAQNGGIPQGMSTNSIPFTVANNPIETGIITLVPATAVAGSAPLEVKFLGAGLGATAKVMVDGTEVPTTWVSGGDIRFTVDPTTAGTLVCSCRLGHQHPEGHDNVTPQPMKTANFTIT